VFPLLEGRDGVQKMSKSLGNYIGIAEPPEAIYGKTMSIPDTLIEKYLRLVSGLGPEEVARTLALEPRDAKAALARALVRRLHGEEAARRAEDDFDSRFRRHELPEDVPEHAPGNPADLVGTLVELGWYPTRSAARRVVEQGGVRVNGEKVGLEHRLHDRDILQAGKRNVVRVRAT
jgi:tyrosyl-tRNA synthetase